VQPVGWRSPETSRKHVSNQMYGEAAGNANRDADDQIVVCVGW